MNAITTTTRFELLSSCCGSPLGITSLDQITIVSRPSGDDDGKLLWSLNSVCCGRFLDDEDLEPARALRLVQRARQHVWTVSCDAADRKLEREISHMRQDHFADREDFAESIGYKFEV